MDCGTSWTEGAWTDALAVGRGVADAEGVTDGRTDADAVGVADLELLGDVSGAAPPAHPDSAAALTTTTPITAAARTRRMRPMLSEPDRSRPLSPGGLATGAQAPVDDLCLVHDETVVVGRDQARGVADCAVDVLDGSAGPAHEVVMVVADPCLVPGEAATGLDAAKDAQVGQQVQGVVHGLVGDLTGRGPHLGDDVLRLGVRVAGDGVQHREPWSGDPQTGAT
jgi:hypothetical protein